MLPISSANPLKKKKKRILFLVMVLVKKKELLTWGVSVFPIKFNTLTHNRFHIYVQSRRVWRLQTLLLFLQVKL